MKTTLLFLLPMLLSTSAFSEASKTDHASFDDRKSGLEMVHISGGTYTMGGTDHADDGGPAGGADADECPHDVTVQDFLIGKHEVTQADWIEIMGTNPSRFAGNPDYPVDHVSWNDIQVFIEKLNAKTGEGYRLPTEEEWEYAARAGGSGLPYRYAGSDDPKKVAWYAQTSGNRPHAVGTLAPNGLGLHDMSGNIWEWCADLKMPYPCDTFGKSFDSRVLRGGSWSHRASSVRVRDRNARDPDQRLATLGFRLAKKVSKKSS